ncbi:hypothetical protein [Aestuariicoccus sp. MJ-SS9]|uniref:hypothetical protein n=1 Tax=Aestuariicoccus sp. MJ-SS9 TaxID=3079855 RepID=UPI002911D16E|nr:hypothetical protein [Aestuariicoccus sp. MJ-SS9]MDU8910170.1 hypothetical protein [Aestuariicoccus sp. MJ-SS9]
MTYSTVSHWDTTDWTDEMETLARDKFVPLVLGTGAQRTQMVRTGDRSFCVVTEYADADAAAAAQEKIAAIRAQAADELPMTLASTAGGEVFAGG